MNNDYRFLLDSPRVTGRRQQKTTCPQCGRRHCFVRYVDTHNLCNYLSDSVGRCDHEQSCGYHYRPSEYFKDNPWLSDNKPKPEVSKPQVLPKPPMLIPLDMGLVNRMHSPQSTFWQWVVGCAAPRIGATNDDIERVYNDYMIGSTRESDVIFWQINHKQTVLTGHIICYTPDGHRTSLQNWVHHKLKRQLLLPKDYQPPKCLFGEHLLAIRNDADVAIVESEKTAVLMALVRPDIVWLATGGCGNLTSDKLAVVENRRLMVFPDSGCYEKWCKQLSQTPLVNYRVSSDLESYPPNTDLADLLLK